MDRRIEIDPSKHDIKIEYETVMDWSRAVAIIVTVATLMIAIFFLSHPQMRFAGVIGTASLVLLARVLIGAPYTRQLTKDTEHRLLMLTKQILRESHSDEPAQGDCSCKGHDHNGETRE